MIDLIFGAGVVLLALYKMLTETVQETAPNEF